MLCKVWDDHADRELDSPEIDCTPMADDIDRWRDEDGTGVDGDILPEPYFRELCRRLRAAGYDDGTVITADLAEQFYSKRDWLKDSGDR